MSAHSYVTIPPIHQDDPGQCVLLEEGQTVTVYQHQDHTGRITHQRVTINPAPSIAKHPSPLPR